MTDDLTRLAELVAKWRRWADAMYQVRQANRVRECADDLETELRNLAQQGKAGGVAIPEAVELKSDSVLGLARSGDWVITTSHWSTRICDARYAKGWNDCRQAYTTPPSSPPEAGVTDEMVECGYVIKDGSVVWLTEGSFSQYSLKPKPGTKIYALAPQPKDAT